MNFRCIACGALFDMHVRFCPECLESGTIVPMGKRLRALVDSVPEVATARDLLRCGWQTVETTTYPWRIGRGALVVLTGPPGAGKSTALCRALDGMKGNVCLASVEEPPGPSLVARLVRAGVKREGFLVVGRSTIDQLVGIASKHEAIALGIDSVQPADLTPRDLRHLLMVMPHVEVIFAVAQVNAQGRIAGVRALEHEADIVVECEAMQWRVTKSRYEQIGATGPIGLEVSNVDAA